MLVDSLSQKVLVARQAVGLLTELIDAANQDPRKLPVVAAVTRRAIGSLEAISEVLEELEPETPAIR